MGGGGPANIVRTVIEGALETVGAKQPKIKAGQQFSVPEISDDEIERRRREEQRRERRRRGIGDTITTSPQGLGQATGTLVRKTLLGV